MGREPFEGLPPGGLRKATRLKRAGLVDPLCARTGRGGEVMTKILVVDDEPSILHSTGLLLADLGFETITEKDPAKVVDRIRKERPDVLLQDVRMPGLDLERLMKEIRGDASIAGTPVILFSASMDVGDVQARVGATGFLEKPFKPGEVTRAVMDAVEGRSSVGAAS